MSYKRKIEIFSSGCIVCEEAVNSVRRDACPSCEVWVLDMKDIDVANRAKSLGISSVPAVVINDKLADCCAKNGPDESGLRALGLGKPIN